MTAVVMRALMLDRSGGAFRLAEVPRPLPGAGEVRVRVRVYASGVNPLDAKIRAGTASDLDPESGGG